MPEKLILDTDIGTDVDDAWALALCLASDDIDLLGVTLVHADLDMRANIALKMLKLAGRTDIPVYRGISETLTDGAELYWGGHEGADTDFSDVDILLANDGAVDFILDTVDRYPNEVIICPIGPLTNIAEAIRRSPETMRKVKKLVIMGTTYNGEGLDVVAPEHNARVDVCATKIVLESGIPTTIVGLNVTTKVVVKKQDMELINNSLIGNYLAVMTNQLYDILQREDTFMHDPLAVATITDPSLVTTRKMSAEVLGDGAIVYNENSDGVIDVCVDVNADMFEKLLLTRVQAFGEEL